MTATAFAKCHECSALLIDNADDRRAHLAHHRDTAKKLEAQRQRVGALTADVLRLTDQTRDFRRTLDNHPINAEPTEIVVNDIPDEEIDEFEADQPESTYLDDITPPATLAQPTAGEPVEDPTDTYPLAIDRDDQPRNLIG